MGRGERLEAVEAQTLKELRVGMIGSSVMGGVHCMGYKLMPMCFWPAPAIPRLVAISDMTGELAQEGSQRYGFEKWVFPWQKLLKMSDIELVDVVTPNDLHKDMSIEAAEAGKHVYCEKPLALSGKDAKEMFDAVKKAGVKHCVNFNYRMTPAVMLAKQLIDEGRIGKVHHFRANYLQDHVMNPRSPYFPYSWRFSKRRSGSGALGDIGSHAIDLARFLVGEFEKVAALTETFIKERPRPEATNSSQTEAPVDVDDGVCFLARFKGGALGTLEASRFAYGRKNFIMFEINGSKGSIYFNHERMNELKFYSSEDPEHIQGYKTILTGPPHPYGKAWFGIPGPSIGWEGLVTNMVYEIADGIVNDKEIFPNFYDGWKNCEITDAVLKSAEEEAWVTVPT